MYETCASQRFSTHIDRECDRHVRRYRLKGWDGVRSDRGLSLITGPFDLPTSCWFFLPVYPLASGIEGWTHRVPVRVPAGEREGESTPYIINSRTRDVSLFDPNEWNTESKG